MTTLRIEFISHEPFDLALDVRLFMRWRHRAEVHVSVDDRLTAGVRRALAFCGVRATVVEGDVPAERPTVRALGTARLHVDDRNVVEVRLVPLGDAALRALRRLIRHWPIGARLRSRYTALLPATGALFEVRRMAWCARETLRASRRALRPVLFDLGAGPAAAPDSCAGPAGHPVGRTATWRTWLDASPVAQIALALMRDATGHEALRSPARAVALPAKRGIAFWSLTAGVGASTVAALVAHRSAAAGHAPVLIDLDRRVPTLALRAQCAGATIADALLRPGSESELLSRWGEVPFLPGTPELHRAFDGPHIAGLIGRFRRDRSVVLDLGCGAEALDADVLGAIDRLVVVVGPSVAQLQSAFCAVPLLEGLGGAVAVVVIGADPEDAARIARRLPWPFVGAVPRDGFLADDVFATKGPTMRAIDGVIRGLE